MPFTRTYLLFLAAGALLSGWVGSMLGSRREARFTLAEISPAISLVPDAPASTGRREGDQDTAALVRELIAECPKNPENAIRLPAWGKIRGFSLEQVREGLRIAGDPLQQDPLNAIASMLLARWAELDPQAALASVLDRDEQARDYTLRSLVNSWMLRDPDAATRWALDHPQAIDAERLDRLRAAVLLQKPAATALAEARNLPAGARRQVVMLLAQSLAATETDRAKCFDLLDGMSEEDRLHAAQTMANSAERRSPAEALALIESLPLTAEARNAARSKSLQSYARENVIETAAWLDAHPALGTTQDRSYAFLMMEEKDPAAANAWLDRQDAPAALLETAMDKAKLSLSSAHSYAESRARVGERLRSHHSRLQAIDPDAAARWLARATPEVAAFITPPASHEE